MTKEKIGRGKNQETTFTGQVGHAGKEDTPLKKGYDPRYNGPNKNRSCTDIICCFLFLIFLAGLVAVAIVAFVYGDPRLLIYPQDSDGNLCGLGNKVNEKNLFFFDLTVCGRMGPGVFVKGCPTPQVCVKECPRTNYVFLANVDDNDKSRLYCKDNVNKATKTVLDLVHDNDCAAYYLNSTSVINRCLPIADVLRFADEYIAVGKYNISGSDNTTIKSSLIKDGVDIYQSFLKAKEFGDKIVADVVTSWWMILIGLLVAMVISLIWIMLMRVLAGFMVWLTILAFLAIWIFLTAICWYLYYDSRGTNETMSIYLVWRITFEKEKLFMAGGIIFGAILLIVLLILLFLCHRIIIAVALIKQGSRAVGAMWSTLLWPVFPFILQVGVVALWACIATYLVSIGRGHSNYDFKNFTNGTYDYDSVRKDLNGLLEDVPCDVNDTTIGGVCKFIKYGKGDYTIYLQIYNLFMLFWLVNFVSALGQLTLAGAFSSWYWAFDKSKDVPSLPLLGALWRCFRYHLGSLAFGSLLIAIVQIIRTILEYMDHKMKGSVNPVAKFLLKCLKCCFWCLEKILKFFCKNAFIMMAVYGKNFCRSGRRAFKLILNNCVRAFVLDKVTDFLLIVSKLVVVGATGVIAYFFFDGRISFLNEYRPQLNFYLVPIVIVIVASYIIADVFFSVYEMAIDTVFLCFLEDIERNDGSREKPYFMSKGLMKVLGKSNVKVKKQEN